MQQDYNVFISYRGSSSGGLLGKEIYTDLKNAPLEKGQPEVKPFFAPACIPKGENFKESIRSVIGDVSCVILILSKGFFKNCAEKDDMVRFELEQALKNPDIVFIPVIMDGFSFEEELPFITDIFSEEEISRFKHINAINHHGIYDFSTERDVLPIVLKILGFLHITDSDSKGKFKNKWILAFGALALVVILILILTNLSSNNQNQQGLATSSAISSVSSGNTVSQTQSQNTSSKAANTATTTSQTSSVSSTAQNSNQSTNQIPQEYANEVEALKHQDALALSNKTLRIKVGEKITPSAASVWKQVTIYSQNTSVAVADGLTVKGVSQGETYIIVEAYLGSTTAYYVIVE